MAIGSRGTTVFYNGVRMYDCETKRFHQVIAKDESANLIHSKWVISVESTVIGFTQAADSSGDPHAGAHYSTVLTRETSRSATDRMRIIQKRLQQPRKDFYMTVTGPAFEDLSTPEVHLLLAAAGENFGDEGNPRFLEGLPEDTAITGTQFSGDEVDGSGRIIAHKCADCNNGPKPINVDVVQIFGGRALRISFEIEVHRTLCGELGYDLPEELKDDDLGVEQNKFVLSNTWSTTETCDQDWRRTRILEGTLRVRDRRTWAHGFRSLCIPGLQAGYRRMSMRFASDPTNLVLKYRIEDKQAEAAPPWPAIDWSIRHTDTARGDSYGFVNRQVSITIKGKPKADRANLVGVGLNVLNLRFAGVLESDPELFKAARPIPLHREALIISQSNVEPSIEIVCNIRQLEAGIGGFEKAVESSSSNELAIDGYNPDVWPTPRPYDADSPAGLFACYLQNPCSVWHGVPNVQKMDLDEYETNNPAKVAAREITGDYWRERDYELYESETVLNFEPQASINRLDHTQMPYTFLEIDTHYETDQQKMVMPLSSQREVAALNNESSPRGSSVSVIPIAAKTQRRVISIVATRHGRPPEIPEPSDKLLDPNGILEHLVGRTDLILEAPHPSIDQDHRVFKVQAKLVYQLERPIATGESFRSANNLSINTTPLDNMINTRAIFSRGRVEHHAADPYYMPQEQAPTEDPGFIS